jgi:hypothetical protein
MLLAALIPCACAPCVAGAADYTLIVAGLGGEAPYETRFREQASALADFARSSTSPDAVRVLSGPQATREHIRSELAHMSQRAGVEDSVTIVLIGHGSFDGEEYRFNAPGPDLTGTELLSLFDRLPARNQLIVNATSASGAVIETWRRPGRIVITATKNGGERTATRFAQHWMQSVTTPAADVNKDDLVTALEAFNHAQRQVEAAFKADVSLATEHARLDGENASAFAVARFGAARASSGDPAVAALLTERGALELELDEIKQQKPSLEQDAYYDQLEGVLVKLALLQRQIDAKQAGGGGGA